jgi:hypothetical protein
MNTGMQIGKSNNNSAMGAPISPSHDTLFPNNLQSLANNKAGLNPQMNLNMMMGGGHGSQMGGILPSN